MGLDTCVQVECQCGTLLNWAGSQAECPVLCAREGYRLETVPQEKQALCAAGEYQPATVLHRFGIILRTAGREKIAAAELKRSEPDALRDQAGVAVQCWRRSLVDLQKVLRPSG